MRLSHVGKPYKIAGLATHIQPRRDNGKTNILILGSSGQCSFRYTMLIIRLNWNSELKENLEKYNRNLSCSSGFNEVLPI